MRNAKNPRGYILLEVAIGGVMVALVGSSLLFSLADARVRNVVAGRDSIAAQIALDKIEEVRAGGVVGIGTTCTGATQNIGLQGVYKRQCSVTTTVTPTINTNGNACSPKFGPIAKCAVTVTCKQFDVKVTYTANLKGGGATTNLLSVDTTGLRTIHMRGQVCQ